MIKEQQSIAPFLPSKPFSLPTEIWDECWSYTNFPELSQLCLVCRLFCQLCQKRLFQSLSLKAPNPDEVRANNMWRWIREFTVMIRRHTTLGHDPKAAALSPLVSQWKITGFSRRHYAEISSYALAETFDAAWRATVGSLISSLPRYQNLRTINSCWLDVDENCRAALAGIPSLEVLDLFDCNITASKGSCLPLRVLELMYNSPASIVDLSTLIELVLPNRLEKLVFHRLRHPEDLVLPALIQFPSFPCLTYLTLTVHPDTAALFFSLLEKTPRLLNLHLTGRSVIPLELIPRTLPLSVAPRLQYISVPVSLAAVLAAGRPVQAFRLNDCGENSYALFLLALSQFSQASVPVHTLSLSFPGIRPHMEIFALICDYFPHLRDLSVEFQELFGDDDDEDASNPGSDSDQGDDEDSGDGHIENALMSSDGQDTEVPVPSEHTPEQGPLRHHRVDECTAPPTRNHIYVGSSLEAPKIPGGVVLRLCDICAIQVDEHDSPSEGPDTFSGLMSWLALGRARLPPSVEQLQLTQHVGWDMDPHPVRRFTVQEQRSVVMHLARHYPTLNVITLGFHGGPWVRVGDDLWREPME
ncbi:hypothetical protein BV22DRAFT_1134000 [Leucogyrophana mollusca]|uniref:Uncharacterized protein n=1 Tax=Leucogyrophana mollusca TaxID=85980 RepID=A0ACB8B122_9AGAM|nr:hypothetical protein BV22DRAFT_1134000 [Leucogyrophana mollusca]